MLSGRYDFNIDIAFKIDICFFHFLVSLSVCLFLLISFRLFLFCFFIIPFLFQGLSPHLHMYTWQLYNCLRSPFVISEKLRDNLSVLTKLTVIITYYLLVLLSDVHRPAKSQNNQSFFSEIIKIFLTHSAGLRMLYNFLADIYLLKLNIRNFP